MQMIVAEMFKVYRNISSPIFSEIFYRRDIKFAVPNISCVFHGIESISYLGPKTKELTSVDIIQKKN